jgi:hypothetical protein
VKNSTPSFFAAFAYTDHNDMSEDPGCWPEVFFNIVAAESPRAPLRKQRSCELNTHNDLVDTRSGQTPLRLLPVFGRAPFSFLARFLVGRLLRTACEVVRGGATSHNCLVAESFPCRVKVAESWSQKAFPGLGCLGSFLISELRDEILNDDMRSLPRAESPQSRSLTQAGTICKPILYKVVLNISPPSYPSICQNH